MGRWLNLAQFIVCFVVIVFYLLVVFGAKSCGYPRRFCASAYKAQARRVPYHFSHAKG
jgi:hypothetical protein